VTGPGSPSRTSLCRGVCASPVRVAACGPAPARRSGRPRCSSSPAAVHWPAARRAATAAVGGERPVALQVAARPAADIAAREAADTAAAEGLGAPETTGACCRSPDPVVAPVGSGAVVDSPVAAGHRAAAARADSRRARSRLTTLPGPPRVALGECSGPPLALPSGSIHRLTTMATCSPRLNSRWPRRAATIVRIVAGLLAGGCGNSGVATGQSGPRYRFPGTG
jgi:hypothetical protein